MCVSSPFFSFSTSQLRVVSKLFALMHDTFSIPVCSQLSGPAQEPAVLFPIDQPTPQPLSTLSMPCPNQLCITRREKKLPLSFPDKHVNCYHTPRQQEGLCFLFCPGHLPQCHKHHSPSSQEKCKAPLQRAYILPGLKRIRTEHVVI